MTDTEHQTDDKISDELAAIRALNQVNLVDEKDEGTSAEKLSNGIYGFSWSPQSEAPLFRKQGFQSFEVHKATDGEIYLIGYVNEEDANKLAAGGNEEFTINLYPAPYEQATKLVSVVRSHILHHGNPSRDAGNSLKLKLELKSATLQ